MQVIELHEHISCMGQSGFLDVYTNYFLCITKLYYPAKFHVLMYSSQLELQVQREEDEQVHML